MYIACLLLLGYDSSVTSSDYPVIFSYFNCNGNEGNLTSCGSGGLSQYIASTCSTLKAVTVSCEGRLTYIVILYYINSTLNNNVSFLYKYSIF